MSDRRYFVGLDLGQAHDYTAIAVLEKLKVPSGELERDPNAAVIRQPRHAWELAAPLIAPAMRPKLVSAYHCRHLERLALGMPYPAQVARVRALLATPPLTRETELVVDSTGVGRAVLDLLRAAHLSPTPVTIHGGDAVTYDAGMYHCPKRDLVATVQVLLQSDRLKIAEQLPDRAVLVQELQAFQMKLSPAGHDSYGAAESGWREGAHDDILLAVALAAWRGESIKELHFY